MCFTKKRTLVLGAITAMLMTFGLICRVGQTSDGKDVSMASAIVEGGSNPRALISVLESSLAGDPEIREQAVKALEGLEGSAAELVRVLMYAKETDGRLRILLLRQIAWHSPIPLADLKRSLKDFSRIRSKDEREARTHEIDSLEVAAFRHVVFHYGPPSLADAFLMLSASDVLCRNPNWVRILAHVAACRGRSAETMRLMLWTVAQEEPVREALLLQLRSSEGMRTESGRALVERQAEGLSDAERKVRESEIERFWSPEHAYPVKKVSMTRQGGKTVVQLSLPGNGLGAYQQVGISDVSLIRQGVPFAQSESHEVRGNELQTIVTLTFLTGGSVFEGGDASVRAEVCIDSHKFTINAAIDARRLEGK